MTAIRHVFRCWSWAVLIPLTWVGWARAEDQDLASAMARLPRLEMVDGYAVGSLATPGRFYVLSKLILEKGDRPFFTRLLTDESPVARCMGMYCMVQSGAPDSVKLLMAHLSDSAVIGYCAVGCIFESSSVGAFAYNLLVDQNCLSGLPPSPMIDDAAIETLSVNSLANGHYCHLSEDCRIQLHFHHFISDNSLTLTALRSRVPTVAEVTLVKAIGRMDQDDQIKRMLMECVGDGNSDREAKMAAWSALTRYCTPDVQQAVEKNLEQLDQLEPGFRNLIERSASISREHAVLMDPVNRERTWMGMEAIKDKVIQAYSLAEPVALNDLLHSSRFAIVIDHPEVKRVVLASLIALGKKQSEYNQAWCTFSDYPEQMRNFVRMEHHFSNHPVWSEHDLLQIEASL